TIRKNLLEKALKLHLTFQTDKYLVCSKENTKSLRDSKLEIGNHGGDKCSKTKRYLRNNRFGQMIKDQ
ncbi:hypothetical protein SDJN02_08249, partial [Cucurbita argyrosperma subsp. argyrosperma]